MKQQNSQTHPRRRNLAAMAPIMRKGGVHQRSRSSGRQQGGRILEAELLEWWQDSSLTEAIEHSGDPPLED